MSRINLIVAASENNVIGKENNLPWSLPDDMIFFKNKTLNSAVIMGRKNYLSIPEKFRPLKKRTNIILTTDSLFKAQGCLVANSLESAIDLAKENNDKIFIIGGGQVYKYALNNNFVDIIYITRIHAKLEGDTFFPEIKHNQWSILSKEFHPKDDKHKYSFTFLKLTRLF